MSVQESANLPTIFIKQNRVPKVKNFDPAVIYTEQNMKNDPAAFNSSFRNKIHSRNRSRNVLTKSHDAETIKVQKKKMKKQFMTEGLLTNTSYQSIPSS